MRVLQIVPRLRPEVCGVGDYALTLAEECRARHGFDTQFLVLDPRWAHGNQIAGFPVTSVDARLPADVSRMVRASDCDVAVLQYSGYGFHKRGTPVWLPRGLTDSHLPLLTMFHELFATGPVNSSAFWLSPVMRLLARQLAGLSQRVLTNREASAQWLGGGATALPVFSSLGETRPPVVMSAREPWLAVFGYQARGHPWYWERLRHLVDKLKPSRVVALGRSCASVKAACGDVPCQETGVLPADAVSRWLARCRFGFFSYPPAFLGKSGILAAYMAHGLCTVLADDAETLSEGLQLGRHLISVKDLTEHTDLESVAADGASWYAAHSRAATADLYAVWLQNMIT